MAGACNEAMKVAVSFCQGEKIGRRRLYSEHEAYLKIFLIEGTVFGLRVREDFSVTSIMPYTGSLISEISIVVRGRINKIGPQGIETALDFTALVASYLIIFHGRGWGIWGRLCNSC